MKKLFQSLSVLVAITCLVWVIVLWRWQATAHDFSLRELALYLGALPLVLFAVAVTARWAFTGLDERVATRAGGAGGASPGTAASAPATPGALPATTGEAELMTPMHLLTAALRCAAASSASELARAIGTQRPGLDKELRDDDGLPVMAARIDGLDVDALSPPLGLVEGLARHRDAAWASMEASPSIGRALCALSPCLDTVFDALRPWHERLGTADEDLSGMDSASQAGVSQIVMLASGMSTSAQPVARMPSTEVPSTRAPTARAPARILVFAAWPADATPFDRAVADLWLQRAMDERREGIVAAGRIVRPPIEATNGPTLNGPALLRHADEAMVRMRRESATDDLVLLLAAESHVTESCVQRWQREGLLCTSRTPKGRIPGEAAAALLLAPVAWPRDDAQEPGVVLHRPPIGSRDKSVEAAGRIDAKVATRMAEQAIAVAGLEPGAIDAVVSDADQATARNLETHAAVHTLLAHLDSTEGITLAGVPCGHAGAASTLIAVALAAHHALEHGKPCLALSVGDPLARAAIVARVPSSPLAPALLATTG